jgi:PPK2 family polyphosphate:nucleotide phosphotransferase
MKKSPDDMMSRFLQGCRVRPGSELYLSGRTSKAVFSGELPKRGEKKFLEKLHGRLERLQEVLYAEHKRKILVVLQGMDTAGKDGTIRHVFQGVNPQGVRVAVFKVPTQEESDYDYLWRVHKQAPMKGQIVIFNRSHYEDVVTTRVHGLITPKEAQRRYRQINDFERMLTEEGTVILKFFLHIDKEEQKRRLKERQTDPEKNWKMNPADFKERKFWSDYMQAYSEAISATSTTGAPWFIIPADKKAHRNLAVSWEIVEALRRLDMKFPKSP